MVRGNKLQNGIRDGHGESLRRAAHLHEFTVPPTRFAPQAKTGDVQSERSSARDHAELRTRAASLQKETAKHRIGQFITHHRQRHDGRAMPVNGDAGEPGGPAAVAPKDPFRERRAGRLDHTPDSTLESEEKSPRGLDRHTRARLNLLRENVRAAVDDVEHDQQLQPRDALLPYRDGLPLK